MKNHIQVGNTRKPFGVNGELKLQIEPQYFEDVLKTDVLFIEINGALVPYFIDQIKTTADLIVQFEDLDTREKAAKLVSRPVYLHERNILPPETKEIPVEAIEPHLKYLNYLVEDVNSGPVGKILKIEAYPQQDMAFVEYEGRKVMIPLHPDFIIEEDKKNRKLMLDLPEGLLAL